MNPEGNNHFEGNEGNTIIFQFLMEMKEIRGNTWKYLEIFGNIIVFPSFPSFPSCTNLHISKYFQIFPNISTIFPSFSSFYPHAYY